MICKRLGFSYVTYTLVVVKDVVVSKCEFFVNKDIEFISAYQIRNSEDRCDNEDYYEKYISILEKNGIEDSCQKLEDMYILDYLIMNEYR